MASPGSRTRACRVSHGWSQRDLAAKLTDAGFVVDASAVSHIEADERDLRLSEAVTLVTVLGITLDYLAGVEPTSATPHVTAAKEALSAAIVHLTATRNAL